MRANYHTHTYRCNHASGTEEEYIQCALDGNIEVLGFSDHTPYFSPVTIIPAFVCVPTCCRTM